MLSFYRKKKIKQSFFSFLHVKLVRTAAGFTKTSRHVSILLKTSSHFVMQTDVYYFKRTKCELFKGYNYICKATCMLLSNASQKHLSSKYKPIVYNLQ